MAPTKREYARPDDEFFRDVERTILATLKQFGGIDLDDPNAIAAMAAEVGSALIGIKANIHPSVVAWPDHIDVHLEHDRGPDEFEMNIRLDLKGEDVDYPKAAN